MLHKNGVEVIPLVLPQASWIIQSLVPDYSWILRYLGAMFDI